jgi:hypothetical protein
MVAADYDLIAASPPNIQGFSHPSIPSFWIRLHVETPIIKKVLALPGAMT